ncbi:nucleic acid-binding, OB-fold protein [Tanacetum coccineum]
MATKNETYVASVKEIDYVQLGVVNLKLQPRAFFSFCTAAYTELSSSSSTMILDDDEIHALKELKMETSGVELPKESLPVDHSKPKDGTLENLLIWACNRKNDSATFNCKARIDNVRTKKDWNYLSCGGDKCKKGITRKDGKFWCDACSKLVDYPVLRFRLELGVSNDTTHAVVVMFDETTTDLVKYSTESILEVEDESSDDQSSLRPAIANIIGTTHVLELKSHTYYEYGSFESFTCWKINPAEVVEENASSSTVDAVPVI